MMMVRNALISPSARRIISGMSVWRGTSRYFSAQTACRVEKKLDYQEESVSRVRFKGATEYTRNLTDLSIERIKDRSYKDIEDLDRQWEKFLLDPKFVESFKQAVPPFGFNGLGDFVYRRTYSRVKKNGNNEEWFETVQRVVEGTFNMQKEWLCRNKLPWNEEREQNRAQKMYAKIFNMKFLPPGRGLWAMGSPLTEERRIFAALNNCAFVSTKDLKDDPSKPFCFLMDASMLGVGVGFDTRGAQTVVVQGVDHSKPKSIYIVDDSREGWVEVLRRTVKSYFLPIGPQDFDFSKVRPAGSPIRGFGGVASGPGALIELVANVRKVLDNEKGKYISTTAIVDIMNFIGKCVVAGNVRRTAEIAFGDADDLEYLDLKDYSKNPDRMAHGWTSNNSVFAPIGTDYKEIVKRIQINGEPGFAWLENMQKFGRVGDGVNNLDWRASGGNPCLEQTLESQELCCLVETFPEKHDSLEEFLDTLEMAFLYAKTVTLGSTHWPESNQVMLRNRRIGCSMSGIAQFISNRGLHEFKTWCEEGYKKVCEIDRTISETFGIPESIKKTSIKPSGTVSLLAGATPGMHYPESRFYIRRVRVSEHSDLVPALREAGYPIEKAVGQEGTLVVEIPVDCGKGIRTLREVSMWEQLSLAAFLQEHWADNQVSCTVTFQPESESNQLEHALNYFQYKLKGVSFLPIAEKGSYPQMPYEEISEEEYLTRLSAIDTSITLRNHNRSEQDFVPDRFCDSNGCMQNEQ